jgi:hypothetical protein
VKLSSLLPSFGKSRPRRITVREAWLDPDRYADQIVSLGGVVRAFDLSTPAPYFTLDDGPQRIGLNGGHDLLSGLTGQSVRATGRLTFKPGVGIFLDVEAIDATRER